MEDELRRCAWVTSAPLYRAYHDREWGTPLHDERRLFEMLCLEGAQAGLSWYTILSRRDSYRGAFAGFDPVVVAEFTDADCARLLTDPGIVRNRLKIASVVKNARVVLVVQREWGSFDTYLWHFVGGRPQQNAWRAAADVPAHTSTSDALSRDLKRRGFSFVGSTICYALMQATGMVNDHLVDCFRWREVRDKAAMRPSGG